MSQTDSHTHAHRYWAQVVKHLAPGGPHTHTHTPERSRDSIENYIFRWFAHNQIRIRIGRIAGPDIVERPTCLLAKTRWWWNAGMHRVFLLYNRSQQKTIKSCDGFALCVGGDGGDGGTSVGNASNFQEVPESRERMSARVIE